MKTVTLGRTGITVSKNGFGALPIQRITRDEAAKLLRKAYDGGITLFDTARAYSDSEEKIGYAMSDIRNHIYITTKTAAQNAEEFWKDLLSYKTADLFPSAGKKSGSNGVGDKQRLVPDNTRGRLTSKALENYMSQKKPYLDPDFKLTDMAEAMGVNRTVMSNFINQTYGKNFNCYLNLWRIEEYQILMAHPSNERKNPYQVMVMAGFKDSRHFQRAIRLEKAAKKQPDEKPQIKNKEG